MEKVCIVFPYSMGNDFMSGGVTKLVIQNLIVCSQKYETHFILPRDNMAFEQYVNENISGVQVHRVDFDFIASYADTSDFVKRLSLVSKRFVRAMKTRKNPCRSILSLPEGSQETWNKDDFSYFFHTVCEQQDTENDCG